MDWPDSFDIRNDTVFSGKIRPYIEAKLLELKTLDGRRAKWVLDNLPPDYRMTYFFYDHALQVAASIKATVHFMNLPDQVGENLYQAMLIHDIGKLELPLDIWDMIEKPEDDIKRIRRSHTTLGAAMLRRDLALNHPFLDLAEDIILNHHEQMDGKGYRGLPAVELSLPVRLACIVESFDGYRTPRPHFGARDVSDIGVLKRMREEKGAALYDLYLLDLFIAMKTEELHSGIQ